MENLNYNNYNRPMGLFNYPFISNEWLENKNNGYIHNIDNFEHDDKEYFNYPHLHNHWLKYNSPWHLNNIKDFDYDNMLDINHPQMNNTQIPYRKSPVTINKIHITENLKEAIVLIKKSVENEKEDEMFYDTLLSQTNNKQDKEIIQSIITDERKHNKMFRELYPELTGITLPKSENKTTESNTSSYINNLEKALFGELSAVEKYRKIMAAMPDKQKYNMLMEIMTDELKHAHKYNFLITKNIKRL